MTEEMPKKIDAVLWRECRDRCRVRCFWDEEAEVGHLVHRPGGSERAQWVFDYDRGSAEHNDENGYRSGAHAFCPGEYVIGDPASEMHTFRVISLRPAT